MATTVRFDRPTSPRVPDEDDARWWWVLLVSGCLILLIGFAILNGWREIETVWTVAVLAGVVFTCFAMIELARAILGEGWTWLHVLLSVGSGLAGVAAFVWPGQTFLTLASIIGWYLLFAGVLHIAQAFALKGIDEPSWWIAVVIGVAEVLLAVWAVGYPGRSIQLLVLWLSATCLTRGLLQVILAFSLRSSGRRAAVA